MRLALRCICSRLDAGGVQTALPLLQLLSGLLEYANASERFDATGRVHEAEASKQEGAQQLSSMVLDAIMELPILLEVLQDLYAQTAWHLPAAEMLAKLRGEQPLHNRSMQVWQWAPYSSRKVLHRTQACKTAQQAACLPQGLVPPVQHAFALYTTAATLLSTPTAAPWLSTPTAAPRTHHPPFQPQPSAWAPPTC